MTQSRKRRWQVTVGGPVMKYRQVFIDDSLPKVRVKLRQWLSMCSETHILGNVTFEQGHMPLGWTGAVLEQFDRAARQIKGKTNIPHVSAQFNLRNFYLDIDRIGQE
jgi:hypothetical protein